MKNIKELTDIQAKEILEFVYPNNKDYYFQGLSFEPKIDKDGKQQVSFGMRPIIGINYHNGQDRCILHFDNTKVVLWLYKNGFDVEKFLEYNAYLSEVQDDFDNFAFAIEWLVKTGDRIKEGVYEDRKEPVFTVDSIKDEATKLLEQYYYKDYE